MRYDRHETLFDARSVKWKVIGRFVEEDLGTNFYKVHNEADGDTYMVTESQLEEAIVNKDGLRGSSAQQME